VCVGLRRGSSAHLCFCSAVCVLCWRRVLSLALLSSLSPPQLSPPHSTQQSRRDRDTHETHNTHNTHKTKTSSKIRGIDILKRCIPHLYYTCVQEQTIFKGHQHHRLLEKQPFTGNLPYILKAFVFIFRVQISPPSHTVCIAISPLSFSFCVAIFFISSII
jgi:hypothetical protein